MKHWYDSLKDRYKELSPDVQILNMASDLQKAKNLMASNKQSAVNHLFRAIILLDYIINDPKWVGKLKELLRLREVIGSLTQMDQHFGTIDQCIYVALLMEGRAYLRMNCAHPQSKVSCHESAH